MADPGTAVLVVVVTVGLVGILCLLFWAGNRLEDGLVSLFAKKRQAKLSDQRMENPRPSGVAAESEVAGVTLAEDATLDKDLRTEVEAMMAADLDPARRWMEEELLGRDPRRLRRLLKLLGDWGETHALPLSAVALRLSYLGADLKVRVQALRILAGLKVPFDEAVRRVLENARQERDPALRNAASWAWCELGRPEDLGLVRVPAGEFLMGSVEEKFETLVERPQHTLHLPTFYIGRYPVTVGDFSEFLAASGYKLPKEDRFRELNLHPNHPVVVSWTEAAEYALGQGMSLPSEAEWEKAARGTDGRRYPWGNEWQAGHANTVENWPKKRKATTTPVGSFSPQGDSPYGCRDMAGNVWEWTRCLDGPYPYDPFDGREGFGTSLAEKGWQMMRGGSCDNDREYARCAFRCFDDFRTPEKFIGFRVVLAPFSTDL